MNDKNSFKTMFRLVIPRDHFNYVYYSLANIRLRSNISQQKI